ncbi:MAG TPA: thymidine phosphorylase family protein [Thermodesulfobacteriota bacterium]|nr:thymidine phosphorylase family protein [Thermodesulfobacteriota bacterium]
MQKTKEEQYKTVNKLVFKELGIETQHEHIVFMRDDSHVCVSEGFEALTRVRLSKGKKSIVASLNVITSNQLLEEGEIGLSNSAQHALGVKNGDYIEVAHLSHVNSLSSVRSKIYGNKLDYRQMQSIIQDIVKGNYSNVHLSAFITACAGSNMEIDEITNLTQAMISTGEQINWGTGPVVDKHCIGGLPGNRTTPIVVAVAAAAGLKIPKTSSRAITSPAGTADMMETMTPVDLSINEIKKIVSKEGGCIVWGGIANLSPADDALIRVERALDLDSEGQLVASVLSKKVAAGSTHVLIDIPVGKTAKVRTEEQAEKLKYFFKVVGNAVDLETKVLVTDGTQPVGRGIGPALEAMDVLSVLRNESDAPKDLKHRSILIAGELLELSSRTESGKGMQLAEELIISNKAYEKFMAICLAQGGFKEPEYASYKRNVFAQTAGIVGEIDNRKLANVAKLAGAPQDSSAGVLFEAPVGKKVKKGQTLFTVYAQSEGELNYASSYLDSLDGSNIVSIVS